ncbi:MAG: 5/3-nucleotidase [Acidobacteriota bacterium]|nr:5/3-nucleotidase [Acidobacteriota bacterium]
MMTKILVTNDDGINSDGLIKLEEAMKELGDVYVVAPASEMSGASHSLTLSRPLRIRKIDDRHWTVDGTPTDCVTLALNTILAAEERPDICVSGINQGGNLGDDATYSGTVAGALEATILGIPGLAFSLVATERYDFTHAARFAITAVRKALAEGLPEGTLLNINLPPGPVKGVRVTTQGIKNAVSVITEGVDPRGKPYYWIGQKILQDMNADGTDYYAVRQGFVSVTPMRTDMTNHGALERIASWGEVRGDDDAEVEVGESPVLERA